MVRRKQAPQAPWRQDDAAQDYAGYGQRWSLWPGAWKSASPRPAPKARAFPAYDQSWEPAPHIQVVKEERAPVAATAELTARAMQQTVNLLRKAESKVAKITKEQQERMQQFTAYERRILDSFIAERKRHADDQERLAQELVEAKQNLAEARAMMARAAAGVVEPQAMEIHDGRLTADDEWTSMVRRHAAQEPPPPLEPALADILRAYKAGKLPVFPGLASGTGSGPAVPVVPDVRAVPADPVPPGFESCTDIPGSGTVLPAPLDGKAPTYGATSPTANSTRPAPYPPATFSQCWAAFPRRVACSQADRRGRWQPCRSAATGYPAKKGTRECQGLHQASAAPTGSLRSYLATEARTATRRRAQGCSLTALSCADAGGGGTTSDGTRKGRPAARSKGYLSGRRYGQLCASPGFSWFLRHGVTTGRQESWALLGSSWGLDRLEGPLPIAGPCFACVPPGVQYRSGQCLPLVRVLEPLLRLLRSHIFRVGCGVADQPFFLAPTEWVCLHWVCVGCLPGPVPPLQVQADSFLDCCARRPPSFFLLWQSENFCPALSLRGMSQIGWSPVSPSFLFCTCDLITVWIRPRFLCSVRPVPLACWCPTSSVMGAPKRGIGGSGSSAPFDACTTAVRLGSSLFGLGPLPPCWMPPCPSQQAALTYRL